MRMINGITLRQAIEDSHANNSKREKEYAIRRLLSRFVDICETIEFAHANNVVHRDIKPANILIGSYGETVIVDWGLAKVLRDSPKPVPSNVEPDASFVSDSETDVNDEDLTRDGDIVGSFGYMSPEQSTGQPQAISRKSDVYALGATLLSILTNRTPGRKGTLDSLMQGIPPALGSICDKAMQRSPDDRYESAGAMAVDVERYLNFEQVQSHSETKGQKLTRIVRRNPGMILTVAAVAFLIAAALTAFAFHQQSLRNANFVAKKIEDTRIGFLKGIVRGFNLDLTGLIPETKHLSFNDTGERFEKVAEESEPGYNKTALYQLAAGFFEKAGENDKRRRCYEKSLQCLRQSPLDEDRVIEVGTLIYIADFDRKAGEFAAAEVLLNEATELCEQNRNVEYMMAAVLFLQGQVAADQRSLESAFQLMEQAIEMGIESRRNDPSILLLNAKIIKFEYMLAELYWDNGKHKEAQLVVERSLNRNDGIELSKTAGILLKKLIGVPENN